MIRNYIDTYVTEKLEAVFHFRIFSRIEIQNKRLLINKIYISTKNKVRKKEIHIERAVRGTEEMVYEVLLVFPCPIDIGQVVIDAVN